MVGTGSLASSDAADEKYPLLFMWAEYDTASCTWNPISAPRKLGNPSSPIGGVIQTI